MEGNKLDGRKL